MLDQLGIIDFHGPNRFYQRENISNLNINLTDISEQYKGNALYNYSNKYNNIKNELASSYVKALLYDDNDKAAFNNLNYSLKCLFENFLPGKEYIGLDKENPNALNFLVRLSSGETHDINELSSGEKEIIFGYLRLRNQSAKNSIILIDEPELHLNPKLARKLPEFYYNSIGKEYNNQIWLVTHSESILKESLNHDGFSIYHLSEPQSGKNQASEISKSKEIESVLIDLIGFNLNNKVVVVEGENSEFDKKMILKLFPEIEKSINIISAGSKNNAIAVHDILNTAYENNTIDKKFFSIVDKDNGKVINNIHEKKFSWDVYHIENHLLNEECILEIINTLELANPMIDSKEKINNELKSFASETIEGLIRHELGIFVEREMKNCLQTSNNSNPVAYHNKVIDSHNKLDELSKTKLNLENITSEYEKIKLNLENSLANDTWKVEFEGRKILKAFVSKHCKNTKYEHFRNLILDKMATRKYQPIGMKNVLEAILND
jgi:hypothetical protein